MLPIEELMKANFRRLTTSHHGDLWPPVSIASREPEMMRREQPSHTHTHTPDTMNQRFRSETLTFSFFKVWISYTVYLCVCVFFFSGWTGLQREKENMFWRDGLWCQVWAVPRSDRVRLTKGSQWWQQNWPLHWTQERTMTRAVGERTSYNNET